MWFILICSCQFGQKVNERICESVGGSICDQIDLEKQMHESVMTTGNLGSVFLKYPHYNFHKQEYLSLKVLSSHVILYNTW